MSDRRFSAEMEDSVTDAFSIGNVLKKIVLFIIFGVMLSLQKLIHSVDAVGQSGGGFWEYVGAIMGAMWNGIVLSLSSVWAFMVSPQLYMASASWGSIIFVVFSLIALLFLFYQPVSLVVNALDGQRGEGTSVFLRAAATILVVIILSCITFYASGKTTFITSSDTLLNKTATTQATTEPPVAAVNTTVTSTNTSTNNNTGIFDFLTG